MSEYIVTDAYGDCVRVGDEIVHRGVFATFQGVTRSPEFGTAKVLVNGAEYFAHAWGLTVETIADEPDFDEVEDEEEDFFLWGYPEEDHSYEDLYDEPYEYEYEDLI